jgi:hypothetical protein
VLESLVARLGAAEKTLADMAPTRQKQGAKAAVPKPQRLINDATADAIIAFGTKYDTAVDDLAKKHLPHATALLAAVGLHPRGSCGTVVRVLARGVSGCMGGSGGRGWPLCTHVSIY